MDIAKIRKKIKEKSETRKGGKHEEREKPREESPEIVPSPPRQPEDSLNAGLPENSRDEIKEKHAGGEDVEFPLIPVVDAVEKENGTAPALRDEEPEAEGIVELLTFNLSAEEYAFRVSDIGEILRYQRIAVVPKMPGYLLGITSLRGKIIPVIDLKKRLAVASAGDTDRERKKILILKGDRGPFGVLIDKVKGVIRISPSEIAEPPSHLADSELTFIEGVVLHNGRFISVIRMEEVSGMNLKIREQN